ncbi:Protein DENND6B [Choanephora cucurbitarum]|uniref:Protein DENND6B n=1 Tax=Choanephora cucurbitarum TaxID=101091 RepID=A0A1C7NBS3_9FUNG|nr:Protein DENND6B [Choanephora cucurbitarum]
MESDITTKPNPLFKHLGQASPALLSSSSLCHDPTSSPSSDTSVPSETDMSEVFDFPIRKQCSTSILQLSNRRLGGSASHPNLVTKDDIHLSPKISRTPSPPFSSTPPSSAGLDITDNDEEPYLTLDPLDLSHFRKWIVGFCVVNFDLEIGQALDYVYPAMDLTDLEQKNIVISILGPAFFDTGQPMLEAACMNIAQWASPEDSRILDLPFLGRLLQVELPSPLEPQLLETTPFDMNKLQPDVQIMASLPIGGLYHHFRDILKDLWLLWELMLLAEPIVIIAPDPCVCSEAVISLVDLINPIPYCGDYRPYFTIQDSDFKSFVTKNKPLSSLVLGVTNPFFNTAVQHWPNIVRVGRQQPRKPDGTLITTHIQSMHPTKTKPGLGTKSNVLFNFVQGVTSKRKSVIARDRELVKMLTEASVRGYPPDWVLNNILRRHFVDLTEKFLVPLNRYFSTLIPVDISIRGEVPRLRPFQTDQFMKSLKEHGPQLPFKSTFKTRTSTSDPTKELYSQFLKCGNFATWLQQRTIRAEAEMLKRRNQAL